MPAITVDKSCSVSEYTRSHGDVYFHLHSSLHGSHILGPAYLGGGWCCLIGEKQAEGNRCWGQEALTAKVPRPLHRVPAGYLSFLVN